MVPSVRSNKVIIFFCICRFLNPDFWKLKQTKMGEYQENSDFEDLLDTDSDDDDEGKKDNGKDSDDNLLR